MKKNKQNYEAPQLTVVEFRMERGFANSDLVMNAQQRIQEFVDQEMLIQVGRIDGNNEVVAADLGANQDQSAGGSAWQYSNGSWF